MPNTILIVEDDPTTTDFVRMYLRRDPYQPTYSYFRTFYHYLERNEGWRKFIPAIDGELDQGFA